MREVRAGPSPRGGPEMADCMFCDIVAGRLPASVVYRDPACLAFLDIRPINLGHTLVVPLNHSSTLSDLDPLDGAAVFEVARMIAVAMRDGALGSLGIRCEGASLFLSDGSAAGQVVGHVHMHVVPRHLGDASGFRRGDSSTLPPTRSKLDQLARALATGVNLRGAR